MKSYHLDLLDETAIAVLEGLEKMKVIALRPLVNTNDLVQSPESGINHAKSPESSIMKFKGSIDLGMTREEIDAEITKMRNEWR